MQTTHRLYTVLQDFSKSARKHYLEYQNLNKSMATSLVLSVFTRGLIADYIDRVTRLPNLGNAGVSTIVATTIGGGSFTLSYLFLNRSRMRERMRTTSGRFSWLRLFRKLLTIHVTGGIFTLLYPAATTTLQYALSTMHLANYLAAMLAEGSYGLVHILGVNLFAEETKWQDLLD